MLLCNIASLFEFGVNFQSSWQHWVHDCWTQCFGFGDTAQLCYRVAIHTSHQQGGRLLAPPPPAVDIVMYMEFSSPNKCGVIPHDFHSVFSSSVQFSCSVMSDCLQCKESPWTAAGQASLDITNSQRLHHSCPSSQWCHPTISSSVIPLSSRFQSFPASGSFQMSQFFASGGQRFRASASASILPKNIQDWFPLGMTGLIQGTLESLLQHHSSKASILWQWAFFMAQLSYPYTTTGKTIALTRWTLVSKVMSLLFNVV